MNRKTQKKNDTKKVTRKRSESDILSRKEARRKKQIRSLLQGLFLGFCICLLLFSIWQLASILLEYRSGAKEYEELKQYVLEEAVPPSGSDSGSPESDSEEEEASPVRMERIDLSALQNINSDAVGWVEIPGTMISYPLVHTSDNLYYLTHTFRRETNKAGSIFIETSNKADFSDLHTIVYGHNMKDGSMFAGLKDYQKESFYETHPYVYVDLADGSHCYEIFSCHDASVTDTSYTIGYTADDKYASFLDAIKSSSLYDTGVSVGTEDSVITLSTCTNSGKDRFVIHAKKIY